MQADSSNAAPGAASSEGSGGKSPEALRAEVEADARAAWRGEPFLVRPNVMDAVISVALTHAWRSSQFVRGSCEMAALLVFVMASDASVDMADAEADAYWYLSQLMAEVQDSITEDSVLSQHAHRQHELLRAYDPPLADLLAEHGLSALPTMRLGIALFTRAGFTLEDSARIWDMLLADPRRFETCDYIMVALLLHTRGDLMQHQNLGSLAETMLAAPRNINVGKLLRTACAVCAFERRCVEGSDKPFPPRPVQSNAEVLEEAVAVAQNKLSSFWGAMSKVGAEAWEVGRTAAKEKMAVVAAEAPAWREAAKEKMAVVAAEAPGWSAQAREAMAGAVAATRASAAVAAETAASAATAASSALETAASNAAAAAATASATGVEKATAASAASSSAPGGEVARAGADAKSASLPATASAVSASAPPPSEGSAAAAAAKAASFTPPARPQQQQPSPSPSPSPSEAAPALVELAPSTAESPPQLVAADAAAASAGGGT